MSRIVAAFALAIIAIGCSGCPHNPPPHSSYPTWDGGAIDYSPPQGEATCLDVCRNGIHLGCPWAAPTDAGAGCVEVCANNQNVAITPFDLNCRARAASCRAVDSCP